MVYLNDIPDLHFCELQALRLDGELSHSLASLNTAENPLTRAKRILGGDSHRIVLCSWSAAWAWGCAPEPHPHLVTYRTTRIHIPPRTGIVVEQRTLTEDDVDDWMTTPLRTVCDLLKVSADEGPVVRAVSALMLQHALSEHDVWNRILSNPTASHKQLISRRMRRVALSFGNSIHVVDRVDSTNRIEDTIEMSSVTHFKDETAERESILSGVHGG